MARNFYCINCGTRLLYGHGYKGNRYYCSHACRIAKPRKVYEVEQTYGKPIRDLLVRWFEEGKSVQVIADMCGVWPQAVFAWQKKFRVKRKIVVVTD